MQLNSSIANVLWMAANLPSHERFRFALRNPAAMQRGKLLALLRSNANTVFGKVHAFSDISTYDEFASRVPVGGYEAFEPWIARIRQGEQNILTSNAVTHLIPTSGSTSARKLIPFTSGLKQEFNSAIGAWLFDLARQFPRILGGPAYWSITPSLVPRENKDASAVPVGFGFDTDYLKGFRRQLASAVMAVPPSVSRAQSLEAFQFETWFHLLHAGDLRLISVWHPSFLALLLDALPSLWKSILPKLGRSRARELANADPAQPETIWPRLQIISCWGDASAREPLRSLRRRFPNIKFQPKGLLATEGVITIPFRETFPLAIISHFFEFIDSAGAIFPAHQLRAGEEYEVVLTTGGGLWRYRLGDQVRVTGFIEETPTLEFIGRGDHVSDVCGEKLSERFVRDCLREFFDHEAPEFAMLAPDRDEYGWRYTLFIEHCGEAPSATHLDALLRKNPHYSYCRDLGQLRESRICKVKQGFQTYAKRRSINGAALGDVKPVSLSQLTDWSEIFRRAHERRFNEQITPK
jgi:hypothetical protein